MPRLLSRSLLSLALLALIPLTGAAALAGTDAATARLNKTIENVTLKDARGKAVALHDLKDKKAVVVVFLSFECPVSTSYIPVLAELARAYGGKGVEFLAVNSSDDGDAAQLGKQAAEFKLPFPVLKDDRFRAADAFGADKVPSAFVLDGRFVLRYRGRIDNGYYARLKKSARTTRFDLRDALDEVLAGRAVTRPTTEPVGCPLVRGREPRRDGAVTYYRDVLPVLQRHCQGCHRPGEVGPFSLLTYRQAVRWAAEIKEYTQARKMPPWKPVAGLPLHGERKMPARDVATLAAWVEGGCPAGDKGQAPPPRTFTHDWQLGKPDLVLTPEGDFHLGGGGSDLYRCFVLPTSLPEDRYVTAVEVRPGNRRIVHHAVLFVDGEGRARRVQQRARKGAKAAGGKQSGADGGPGYSLPMAISFLPGFLPRGGLGGWAPGQVPRPLPEGTGFFLPRGADVVLQLHYHRTGRVEKDRTSVGLYFARKPVSRRMQGVAVPGHFLVIPAGAKRYKVRGSVWLKQDSVVHAVMPHMHLLGRKIKVTMTPPGGRVRTLIAIDDWDFNWQETYLFKEPLRVPAGTRFDVEGCYDNSDGNPSNPHSPPRAVFAGLETTNEMCVGFLGVTGKKAGTVRYAIQPRIQGIDWSPNWGIPVPGL